GSYVLNSLITFAAESERKLDRRAYATFVVSGIAGLIANTAALVLATQILLLPVSIANAIAVLVSFIVNFSYCCTEKPLAKLFSAELNSGHMLSVGRNGKE